MVMVKTSQKWVKHSTSGHISDAISPTDFTHGTKVQSNKEPSMTQVQMIRSRSNFLKISKKLNNLPYLGSYFTYRLHTLYQAIIYKCAFSYSSVNDLDPKVKVKFPKKVEKLNNWPYISDVFIYRFHTWYQGIIH